MTPEAWESLSGILTFELTDWLEHLRRMRRSLAVLISTAREQDDFGQGSEFLMDVDPATPGSELNHLLQEASAKFTDNLADTDERWCVRKLAEIGWYSREFARDAGPKYDDLATDFWLDAQNQYMSKRQG